MFIEKKDGKFVSVYEHEKKLKFIHAIWGTEIDGTPYAFVGNREEDRDLIAIHFDKASGKRGIMAFEYSLGLYEKAIPV